MYKVKLEDITTIGPEDVKAIRHMLQELESELDIEKVILFGSRARGDYNLYSDIDLLLLVNSNNDNRAIRDKVGDAQFNSLMKYDSAIMTIVKRTIDWETNDLLAPLKANVLEEGMEIEY